MKNAICTGIALALAAAVCYGFIPFFTLPLKAAGTPDFLSDTSILFYRFGFASLLVGLLMVVRRKSFRVTRGELVTLTYLAFISDGSSLFLIDSYNYMPSGVATTLHFMYPVVTSLLMMTFYHEARHPATLFAIAMAVTGVGVLSWTADSAISLRGVAIALISAVCYACYLIRVNRSRAAYMDSTKLVFYVMFIGALIFGAEALRQGTFHPISTALQWQNLLSVAFLCTLVTNLCLVFAVRRIGSTMTAVIGALEPLTAVLMGCTVFGEGFTWQLLTGIALIIPAVLIIIYTRRRIPEAEEAAPYVKPDEQNKIQLLLKSLKKG